ncbi:unnamed protein product [Pieris macdunnoughi]|nr:unnamed protein product [Pieris macdunnoughi]
MTTFNCKNIKRSLECIRDLCRHSDIIALQETWLLPSEISYLGSIEADFGYTGTSAMDTSEGMLRGRPYGGVALLWRRSVFNNVIVLPCNNSRVCAIKIITSDRPIIVVCVYMPTDSQDNLPVFTDCLSVVSAIVDEYGIESVYILGDFNAHPYSIFYYELLNYCYDQRWSCIDVELLGPHSDTYTFVSEAHGSRRWLDHCLVTDAARHSISKVYIMYDVLWSDHYPLILHFNIKIISKKLSSIQSNSVNNNVRWGQRSEEEILLYQSECNKRLKSIDFTEIFTDCAGCYCDRPNHQGAIDILYNNIVISLSEAAVTSRKYPNKNKINDRNQNIIGWNKHVKPAHSEARLRFRIWLLHGKPESGRVYNDMCESRKIFKSRLKWCQNHQDLIKMEKLATCHDKKISFRFGKKQRG